jgi:hypothetical protein
LEQIAYDNTILKRDFIYSYFGEGESNIKSIGGIAGGGGGTGGGGGMTSEQLEMLTNLASWWKLDEDNDAIYSEKSVYSLKGVSALGLGSGGGGGGDFDRLDDWADYNETKANWVLSALLGYDLHTRVNTLEASGVAIDIAITGSGNAVTDVSKSGNTLTFTKGSTFALSTHTHTIAQITGLQGALDLKVTQSDIDTAIDGIEIGGRNLITDSANINILQLYGVSATYSSVANSSVPSGVVFTATDITRTNGNYVFFLPILGSSRTRFKVANGERVTVSFYIKTNVTQILQAPGFNLSTEVNATWKKVQHSFTFPASANLHYFLIGDGLTSFEVHSIKMERGTKATDWTPALEDQVSDWNESNASSFSFIKNKPTQLSQFTDNIGVANHISNKANPHAVTKSQVGLGNVDNVKQATKSEFDTHTANSTVHITSTERNNWNDANSKKHTHGNKSVIDALTQGHINVLNKLSLDAQGNVKVDATLWATGGISALGLGDGGSSGGGVDMLDAWGNYTEAKADYYVPASLLVSFRSNTLNRLTSLENGSATSIETTGSGNAITGVSKSGNLLTFNKGLTFALATHTHTIAQITGLQGALDLKATQSDIDTAIDGIEIGGRNLIPINTGIWEIGAIPSATGENSPSTLRLRTIEYINAESNQDYCLSIYSDHKIAFLAYDASGAYIGYLGSQVFHTSSGVLKTPSNTARLRLVLAKNDDSTIGLSDLSNVKIKLEKGNKPTDWTEAPEDELISSRNLWLGTGSPITRSGGNYSLVSRDLRDFISEGDTCTLQFDLTTTLAYDTRIYASLTPNINWGNMTEFHRQTVPLGKSRYRVTFSYKDISTRPYLIFYKNEVTFDTATFENLTLVKGTKAVWSPAPEDQISDWNTTNVASLSYIKNKPTQLSQFTDNIGVTSHIANKANPHSVTKAQVGLSNVLNVASYSKTESDNTFLKLTGGTLTGTLTALAMYYADASLVTSNKVGFYLWGNELQINWRDPSTGVFLYDLLKINGETKNAVFTGNVTASVGINTPKVDFGNGFTIEPSGTELVFKYNGVIKQRMLSDGTILATGGITALST